MVVMSLTTCLKIEGVRDEGFAEGVARRKSDAIWWACECYERERGKTKFGQWRKVVMYWKVVMYCMYVCMCVYLYVVLCVCACVCIRVVLRVCTAQAHASTFRKATAWSHKRVHASCKWGIMLGVAMVVEGKSDVAHTISINDYKPNVLALWYPEHRSGDS